MENQNNLKFKYPLDLQLFAEPDSDDIDASDFDPSDEENGSNENEVDENGDKTNEQSRRKNSEEARKRREREQKEREEKIRKEAFEQGRKDALLKSNKINTFTNEPIEDDADLEIFNLQKEIESRGGDPLKDLPKEFAKLKRESADKEKKNKELMDKATKDTNDFVSHFASQDEAFKVLDNKQFNSFIRGKKGGEKSLYELYKEFKELFPSVEIGKSDGSPKPNSKQPNAKPDLSKMNRKDYDAYFRNKYGA